VLPPDKASEITWPIDFSMIVDWTPLAVGIPGADDPFVHQGIILAKDGSRWVQCVKVFGGWDSLGTPEVELTWKKISLAKE